MLDEWMFEDEELDLSSELDGSWGVWEGELRRRRPGRRQRRPRPPRARFRSARRPRRRRSVARRPIRRRSTRRKRDHRKSQPSPLFRPRPRRTGPVVVKPNIVVVNDVPDRGPTNDGSPIDEPSAQPSIPQPDETIRWAQSTLNLLLGLRLPVDGIIGPETRSAIRTFQERSDLRVDGILGPSTKEALRKARRQLASRKAETEASDIHQGELEQETEVSRRSRAYVRWVQRALNQILGLRLTVDGVVGTQTRSAVRRFQQSRGLSVDGAVGPQTERGLLAAGASSPPSGRPNVSIPTLKSNIVELANREWSRWGNGAIKEGDARVRAVLADYWKSGAGVRLSEPGWWSKYPWSAAFVSWVMRNAGAGDAFRYSAAHAVYTKAAKNNRLAKNDNPFKAFRVTEVKPQVGDLVCKSRAGSGANYENIQPGHKTHCDIVTNVQPGKLQTVGGNVNNSVSRTTVKTDGNGYISDPKYFAIIKVGSPRTSQ